MDAYPYLTWPALGQASLDPAVFASYLPWQWNQEDVFAEEMAVTGPPLCPSPSLAKAIDRLTIFGTVPGAIILIASIWRLAKLSGSVPKARTNGTWFLKLALFVVLDAISAFIFANWCMRLLYACGDAFAGFPASLLGLVSAVLMTVLSSQEHRRTVQPSDVLTISLIVSAACDSFIAQAVYVPGRGADGSYYFWPLLYLALAGTKLLLFVLELLPKTSLLLPGWTEVPIEESSSFINKTFFWWLNGLILHGYRNVIAVSKIYSLDEELQSQNAFGKLYLTWSRYKASTKKNRFLRATSRFAAPAFMRCILPRLVWSFFKLLQPFFMQEVILYVQERHKRGDDGGYRIIGMAFVVYVGRALSQSVFDRLVYRQSTILRGALSSLILHEGIDLGSAQDGSGAVTLLSTDVARITYAIETIHNIWAGLIEFGISMYLLQRKVGLWGSMGPILVSIISTILTTQVSSKIPGQQMQWTKAVERRVTATTSIITAMKEVKLLGTVPLWFIKIKEWMKVEIADSQTMRTTLALMNGGANLPAMFSPVFSFGIALAAGTLGNNGVFDLAYAFTTISIMSIAAGPLAWLMFSIPGVIRSFASFERVEDYLLKVEKARLVRHEASTETGEAEFSDTADGASVHSNVLIEAKNTTFSFEEEGSFALKNINLQIRQGTLTMIVGRVGTGKTVLLNSLIGENITTGTFQRYEGKGIGYCPQTAWLFNGTIRKNIIGEASDISDMEWYNTVIKACALDTDFRELKDGDSTKVGSKGITLSGGQRHRVNLARALYSRFDLCVIDDVLSGLDWATQAHIWTNVFGPEGLLRKHGKTCVLATHHINHVEDADQIVVLGEGGTISQQGSYQDLAETEAFGELLRSRTLPSSSDSESADDAEGTETSQTRDGKPPSAVKAKDNGTKASTTDLSLYGYYLQHIGWKNGMFLAFMGIGVPSASAMTRFWVMIWAQASEANPDINHVFYFSIYALLNSILISSVIFDIWFLLVVLAPRSYEGVHLALLTALMKAPLSYFTTTDAGDIVNRFSKDMQLIGDSLSGDFIGVWFTLRMTIVSAITVIPGSSYLALTIPFTGVFIYAVATVYLPTSRQLRLREIETTAPLNTHILEVVDGLVTIRAFGWRGFYRDTGIELLDDSQKPHYLLLCVQRWLAVVLDLYTAGIGVALVAFAVFLPNGTNVGLMSVALANVMSLSDSLTKLVTIWTSLETSLGAVARVRDFEKDTPAEKEPEAPSHPPSSWPASGEIKFTNATASYSTDAAPAVNNVSFTAKPGQKVAICGRTGSGKSSLLLTLFRLLELDSGSISIDGIDTSTVLHNELREKLIAIPQDATLFPGTVRFNLWQVEDANLEAPSDEELQRVLELVGLWESITAQGGLDKEASEFSLSHGQKQLMCLARAVLRKNYCNVLVLDEAMSAVDSHTEKIMVEVLEKEFATHTIVSVVHRLNTIRDYDLVVVMDKGKTAEMGVPRELLEQEGSRFRALWNGQQ